MSGDDEFPDEFGLDNGKKNPLSIDITNFKDYLSPDPFFEFSGKFLGISLGLKASNEQPSVTIGFPGVSSEIGTKRTKVNHVDISTGVKFKYKDTTLKATINLVLSIEEIDAGKYKTAVLNNVTATIGGIGYNKTTAEVVFSPEYSDIAEVINSKDIYKDYYSRASEEQRSQIEEGIINGRDDVNGPEGKVYDINRDKQYDLNALSAAQREK